MLLKISQNSQKSIFPSVSFLIKLFTWGNKTLFSQNTSRIFPTDYFLVMETLHMSYLLHE